MSWQVLAHRAVDVFNKYTKTSKPQKTHYCGSKQKQTEKGLLQAKDRKKTELIDFQLYTLLPGYVSLLPHVAGCWRLLHQLLGPRDHRGLESAVLRRPDTGATGPASGGHSLQSRGRETVWCRVHLTGKIQRQ